MRRAEMTRVSRGRPIRLPRTIKVGYRKVKVEWWPTRHAQDAEAYGQWDTNAGVIRVAEGLIADEAQNTLLHEVLHSCFTVANIRIDPAAEETIVHSVANVLMQVLHDNPSLTRTLIEPTP